jgi:hypothetical protein
LAYAEQAADQVEIPAFPPDPAAKALLPAFPPDPAAKALPPSTAELPAFPPDPAAEWSIASLLGSLPSAQPDAKMVTPRLINMNAFFVRIAFTASLLATYYGYPDLARSRTRCSGSS